MRKEYITMYDDVTKDNVEKHCTIYRRDELIDYIKSGNINVREYSLDIHTPHCFKCSIHMLNTFDNREEFFIDYESKRIILYVGLWADVYR